jgi:RNA polymerase sigma-70 factor, ECF subfamily
MFIFTSVILNTKTMSTTEFGLLLDKQNQFMRQLALKLTKHMEDAEDLIQDTYFKALKHKDKYTPGTNLKGWLYTIMKNTFINNYRKKKVQNTFIDETDNSFFINQGINNRVEPADRNVDQEYIMKQIDSIEKNYVEAFMMHFNGYKYEEIAEILSIPLGTVKSRIFLARKKMMAKLQDQRFAE